MTQYFALYDLVYFLGVNTHRPLVKSVRRDSERSFFIEFGESSMNRGRRSMLQSEWASEL